MRKGPVALALGALAILAAALIVASSGSSPRAHAAPALPRETLIGGGTDIASLRGHPAVVTFFASWCGPCSVEAPGLERVAKSLHGRARVVAVSWSDSRQGALRFVRRFHWSFSVLRDANGRSGYAYGIQGLPTSFVLDSRGRIVTRLIGPQTPSSLLRALHAAGLHQT